MKREGILMPEVLKLIIGVICLILLIYLAVSLYGIFTSKSDLEIAKAHLKNIQGKLTLIKENGGSFDYAIYNPRGWALVGWPYKSYDVEFCRQNNWKSCLCLCDLNSWANHGPEWVSERCNDNKICFDANVSVMSVNPVSYIFGLFSADKSPILITALNEDFKGYIHVVYNKEEDSLNIKPIKI